MLYHDDKEGSYRVVCSCGQTYPIVKPDLIDQITCGVCGKLIKITSENLLSPEESTTAIYQKLKKQSPEERITEGIRLLKEGKWELAAPILQSVVEENKPYRNAFYGLGFYYYQEQKYLDSFILLGMAVYLGHPNAWGLFEKVRRILKIDDSNLSIHIKKE
ncbi:MAG TPA: hypothetical protein PLX23_07790 [Candidatus Hydrogenedens sp.]|nr:hypothetical protein [Candidatus Hydrogenedens sp.]